MGLEKVICPRSAAVVGPTDKPGSFGRYAAENALRSAIADHVYFVHPKRDELFGKKCYRALKDLPEVVDCVIICTPAVTVNTILTEAGELGVGGAVVYASRFSEVKSEEGHRLEAEMAEICKRYGIKLIGPNCVGVANNLDSTYIWGLNPPFEYHPMKKGTGVIAQSGSLIGGICHKDHTNVAMAISSGNGNIVPLEECMEYMVDNPGITSIVVYMEGIKDGVRFYTALEKAAKLRKPIVLLKAGKSKQGAKSAASHTGNMAGNTAIFDAVFRKYGVLSVDSVDEIVCMAQMISILNGNYPKQPGVATISFSGGESTVMADVCEAAGLELPDIAPHTAAEINQYIPDFASAKNPLDATTSMFTQEENFRKVFSAMAEDPSVGSIVLNMELTGAENARHRCSMYALKSYAQGSPKTAVPFVHPIYENTRNPQWVAELAEVGIPVLGCGESGLKALRKVIAFAQYDPDAHDLGHITRNIHLGKERTALSEFESKQFLRSCGIPVPGQFTAATEEELVAGLADMKYPVVLKIDSPDISHKTEAGGVVLNIQTQADACQAFRKIMESCKAYNPSANLRGVLVQEMVPAGVEVIVGVKNDPQLGPMLLTGLGGIFTEIFRDTAILPCPVSKEEAMGMLKSLKSYKLLTGFRGADPCDVDALADIMVKVSQFALDKQDEIAEMEMNPVIVRKDQAVVVDALIIKSN